MNRKMLFSEINKKMIELFGKKLKEIFLFGSYAKNKQTKDSDIDFFIIVDDTEENLKARKYKIADIMAELSLRFDLLVSITEETYNRFRKYMDILPFYKNIYEEGIKIYGK